MNYSSQLEWIHVLQNALGSSHLFQIYKALDFLDSFWMTLIIIGFVWYIKDRNLGIRLFYIFFLSFLVNTLLKTAFDLPRPCHLMPEVGLVCHSNPGFPSGAAQSAALYSGIIFFESKKTLFRFLGICFAALLCFSRIILGVHFFIDILGGLFVGSLLLLLYKKGFPYFAKYFRVWSFLLPLALLVTLPPKLFYLSGACLGIAFGLLSHEKKGPQKKAPSKPLSFGTAIIGAFIFEYFGMKTLMIKPLFAFIGAYWFSFLGAKMLQLIKTKIS